MFLKTKTNLAALAFCVLSSGFWMIVLAKRHYYFRDGPFDQALPDQNLWAILHGSLFTSITNTTYFAGHCQFLSFPAAGLYWFWPDPLLFLPYLQTWFFFGGAYIFFLVLKKHLHPAIALGAMAAYTLAPANISMLNYDFFTYEPFSIPLVFLVFKALDDNNSRLYLWSCFLLAMVKEQMPLVVIMFGLFSLAFKKEDKIKWALLPVLMGLLVFVFEVFVLTPYIRKDFPVSQSFFWNRYAHWGQTPQSIFLFLLTHPLVILAQFVTPQNIQWYNELFGIWGGLSFFSPHILLAALPLFLKNMLSNNAAEHMVTTAYYAATFTPFIFLGAWNALDQVQNKWRMALHSLALAMMFAHAFFFLAPRHLWPNTLMTADVLAKERFVDKIPPGASVLSSWSTATHLANRQKLYLVYSYLFGTYKISQLKFTLARDTDYLLLDFADEWLLNQNPGIYIPKMTALNFDNRWRLQESIEDVALYVKNPLRLKADRLIERQFQPFPVKNNTPLDIDNSIRLEDMEFPKVFPQKYRIFPVTMYWQCLKKSFVPYEISINVTSPSGKFYYGKMRTIGSTIYPAYFWQQGEYIKESYFYLLPRMPRGNFNLNIFIYSPFSRQGSRIHEENFSVS